MHLSEFHFEIVRGCQLLCRGCPISGLRPKVGRTEVDVFASCLRHVDVDSVGVLRLFNYGEPLLHDDLPGILREIPQQRWTVGEVEISTNAQWVDWASFEEALRMNVLTQLVVSCDGDGSPESYEALRPPSRWSKLLEFLEGARRLRDLHSPDLKLITRTIVPEWSTLRPEPPEVEPTRARWRQLLRPLGWEPELRPFYYLPDSTENMTGRALEPATGRCRFVEPRYLYVDWEGTVIPCCAHPGAGALGSLRHETLSQIRAGSARASFIAKLENDRQSMAVCGDCEELSEDALVERGLIEATAH